MKAYIRKLQLKVDIPKNPNIFRVMPGLHINLQSKYNSETSEFIIYDEGLRAPAKTPEAQNRIRRAPTGPFFDVIFGQRANLLKPTKLIPKIIIPQTLYFLRRFC